MSGDCRWKYRLHSPTDHYSCPNLRFRFPVSYVFIVLSFLFPVLDDISGAFSNSSAFHLAAQDDKLQQGLIALKEDRLDLALMELTAAEQERPADVRVRNFRAIVLVRLGRNEEAANEYREAIRIDSGFQDAYRNLGFLEWTEHRLDDARKELERAVDLSPDDSFAHYYLGRVELDAQLYVHAFREFEQSNVPWPRDAAFLIAAATGYTVLGRQAEARSTLRDLAAMPLSDAQSVQVASLLANAHENETAVTMLQKLTKSREHAHWAEFDLALAYLLAGNYHEAIERAHIYIGDLRPGNVNSALGDDAWSLIGIAHARHGEGEQAISALRQATKLAPRREEHWLNLTRELMELGRFLDAITAVQEGLISNPRSYALQLRLGAANLAADRYNDAEGVFRDLVTAGDPQPTSHIGLAQVLMRTGRADEAASELAVAGEKLGPNFLISYFRGLALERAGRPQDAISAFQEALRLNPNSAEAHLGLGKAELAFKRPNDAITELKETLRIDPGNRAARRLLSQAYRRTGDTKTASKYAEKGEPVAPRESSLLGDFLLPEWQQPRQTSTSSKIQ